MVLNNGDLLYSSDTKVEFVHVIVDGTMEMTNSQDECGAVSKSAVPTSIKLHHGACFGAEAFVPNTTARGSFSAIGRCTLFEIAAKDLVDLSELHHDIMHVLLAWLSQTLAKSTRTMITPLGCPTTLAAFFSGPWEDNEETSKLKKRKGKRRSETG
uniref:Cyclic nucleotide-binding domain-containing protein n=1 Tax=Hyaloperonospora arabidopsidis (strain Emoy2) TaxID=559515 RepID=M4BWQ4_HYAAE